MRYTHLTMYEREVIEVEVRVGTAWREIARRLGRATSTICRELRRAGGPGGYEARRAHAEADQRVCGWARPRRFDDARLVRQVKKGLEQDYSPEQIVGCWPRRLPRVSIQTIYSYLYRDRPEWLGHLRQASARKRASYRHPHKYERIRNMKTIRQRPAMARSRRRVGDWESDTVRGSDKQAGIATHVDRRTGYVVLAKLKDRRAGTYNRRSLAAFRRHNLMAHTFTVDHGMEFAEFTKLEKALSASVYFADAHCAWQRGSNENLNGLLRQYFPKTRDFSTLSEAELRYAESRLNTRPRKRHHYRSPADLMSVALED